MPPSYGNTPCCCLGSYTLGAVRRATLEEPAAGNLHGGVCEGGRADDAMVNLNGHEAGNGGNSQGTPTARRAFLYSDRLTGTYGDFKTGERTLSTSKAICRAPSCERCSPSKVAFASPSTAAKHRLGISQTPYFDASRR
jgi:hypothetical protein